ncbi:adenylyltransferase/cytidyltransferase family protein [Methanolobus halotolerans]|uniref:FAD synthase n=1 Tax=Methanolobus halotolerans TaxID=2052935 RepID=A0A4E0PV61_9EURY|nr:adenylyltransferase/cytidyltransferase family protein [Methanolobus halotolerans]TGC07501.1 FAD synthase [Methanolobus halotolerans]
MVRVIATGTFDLLHPGHIFYLTKARELGDELYVVVARGSMIRHKPKPVIPDEQRVDVVNSLSVVDKAVPGSENDIFEPIREIKPDIIALGFDQTFDIDDLEKELRTRGLDARVVRVSESRTCPLCSTGKIIKKIFERCNEKTRHE